jgi:hypothetical protein
VLGQDLVQVLADLAVVAREALGEPVAVGHRARRQAGELEPGPASPPCA